MTKTSMIAALSVLSLALSTVSFAQGGQSQRQQQMRG